MFETTAFAYQQLSRVAILFILTVSSLFTSLHAQWRRITPIDASVSHLAILDSTIFASDGSRIFSSTNDGTTWVESDSGIWQLPSSNYGTQNITALAAHGKSVYAAISYVDPFFEGNESLYISTNVGESWQIADSGLSRSNFFDYVGFIFDDSTTYIVGGIDGLYKTTNNGKNWLPTDTQQNYPIGKVKAIAVDDTNIYVISFEYGIMRSTNRGTTWNLIDSTLNGAGAIYVKDSFLIVGLSWRGTYRSTDRGTTWKYTKLTNDYPNAITKFNGKLFMGTSRGVYISTDSGATWSMADSGIEAGQNNLSAQAFVSKGAELFCGAFSNNWGGGVYVTGDDGRSWVQKNIGLPDHIGINALAAVGNKTLVATPMGIFTTSDNGRSWAFPDSTSALYYVNIHCLVFDGGDLIAGTQKGIFISSDSARTWEHRNSGLPDTAISALDVNGTDLFVGIGNSQIFRSTDGGNTWMESDSGIAIPPYAFAEFASIASIAGTRSRLFAAFNTFDTTSFNNIFFIFQSTDNGANWSPLNLNIQGSYIYSIQNFNNEIMLIATDSGLFRYDGAKVVAMDLYNSFPGLYINGNEIFASTYINEGLSGIIGKVYHTADGGMNWQDISDGLENSTLFGCFTTNGGFIFGGDAGVWLRSLSEIESDVHETPVTNPRAPSLLQNYPNPFNPRTSIAFRLNEPAEISLKIFDALGREIITLAHGNADAGYHCYQWDAEKMKSGVYFCRFHAGSRVQIKQMLLIK